MNIKLTGMPEELLPMVLFLRANLDIVSIREYPTPGHDTRTMTVDLTVRLREVGK